MGNSGFMEENSFTHCPVDSVLRRGDEDYVVQSLIKERVAVSSVAQKTNK